MGYIDKEEAQCPGYYGKLGLVRHSKIPKKDALGPKALALSRKDYEANNGLDINARQRVLRLIREKKGLKKELEKAVLRVYHLRKAIFEQKGKR